MKNKYLIILLLVLTPYCYSSMYPTKSYRFEYNYNGEKFPVVISQQDSYDEALEEAATQCFNHFTKTKGNEKVSLPTDKATELIDECTNPSKKETVVKNT